MATSRAPKRTVVEIEGNHNSHYPIRPYQIAKEGRFKGVFDSPSQETAARHIITFFQEKGYWGAFEAGEFTAFYRSRGGPSSFSSFGDLVNNEFLVRIGDGPYCVAHTFIVRCFESQPDESVFR